MVFSVKKEDPGDADEQIINFFAVCISLYQPYSIEIDIDPLLEPLLELSAKQKNNKLLSKNNKRFKLNFTTRAP